MRSPARPRSLPCLLHRLLLPGGGLPAARDVDTTLYRSIEALRKREIVQLSTMDLLVLASMKNAAKCDK